MFENKHILYPYLLSSGWFVEVCFEGKKFFAIAGLLDAKIKSLFLLTLVQISLNLKDTKDTLLFNGEKDITYYDKVSRYDMLKIFISM